MKINVKRNPYYQAQKSLSGFLYLLTFRWNVDVNVSPLTDYNTGKWYMDLLGLNNDIDIKGKCLLPGKELLAKHGYRELGTMWVFDNSDRDENPNFDDFGTRWTLEYYE